VESCFSRGGAASAIASSGDDLVEAAAKAAKTAKAASKLDDLAKAAAAENVAKIAKTSDSNSMVNSLARGSNDWVGGARPRDPNLAQAGGNVEITRSQSSSTWDVVGDLGDGLLVISRDARRNPHDVAKRISEAAEDLPGTLASSQREWSKTGAAWSQTFHSKTGYFDEAGNFVRLRTIDNAGNTVPLQTRGVANDAGLSPNKIEVVADVVDPPKLQRANAKNPPYTDEELRQLDGAFSIEAGSVRGSIADAGADAGASAARGSADNVFEELVPDRAEVSRLAASAAQARIARLNPSISSSDIHVISSADLTVLPPLVKTSAYKELKKSLKDGWGKTKTGARDGWEATVTKMRQAFPKKRAVEIPSKLSTAGREFDEVNSIVRTTIAKNALVARQDQITRLIARLPDRPMARSVRAFSDALEPSFKETNWAQIPSKAKELETLLLHTARQVPRDKLLADMLQIGMNKIRRGENIINDKAFMSTTVARMKYLQDVNPASGNTPATVLKNLNDLGSELRTVIRQEGSWMAKASPQTIRRYREIRSLSTMIEKNKDILEHVSSDELLAWMARSARQGSAKEFVKDTELLTQLGQHLNDLITRFKMDKITLAQTIRRKKRETDELDGSGWMFSERGPQFFYPEKVLAIDISSEGDCIIIFDEDVQELNTTESESLKNITRTKRDIGSFILAELRDIVAGPGILLGDIIDYARHRHRQEWQQVRELEDVLIT